MRAGPVLGSASRSHRSLILSHSPPVLYAEDKARGRRATTRVSPDRRVIDSDNEGSGMSFAVARKLIVSLIFATPIVIVVFANIIQAIRGENVEPFFDNLAMYVLLLPVLGSAAIVMFAYFRWRGLRPSGLAGVSVYALAGTLGATAFTVFLDAADEYFTPRGVGWALPVTGAVLGVIFGTAFRGISALIERSSRESRCS